MNPLQHLLIFLVRCYRWVLSPAKNVLFGPVGRCRYTPSCSAYALEAIRVWGAGKGGWIALRRIWRCHPWGGCGHDPVPVRNASSDAFVEGPLCLGPNHAHCFDSSSELTTTPVSRP